MGNDDDSARLTMVYKYRIADDVPDDVVREIRRGHDLRNELTALYLEHQKDREEIWSEAPSIAQAEETAKNADKNLQEARDAVNAERIKRRSKKTPPELRARVKEAREQLRQARREVKQEKEKELPRLKEKFADNKDKYRARVKDTYRVYVGAGLFWATWNDIHQTHQSRVQRIEQARKKGTSANVRFRRWDGTGTIAVQLQRQKGGPPRTPELVAKVDTGKYRNVFGLWPRHDPGDWRDMTQSARRHAAREGYVRVRIGSDAGGTKQVLTLPVVLHRPLPDDAEILMARITRTRLATVHQAWLTVTVSVPAPPLRTGGSTAACHLGWRVLADGSIRVAAVHASNAPPAHLIHDDVVRPLDNGYDVILPAAWRRDYEHLTRFHSDRDTKIEHLRHQLSTWLGDHPDMHAIIGATPGDVAQWKSPARFARLSTVLHAWFIGARPDPPGVDDAVSPNDAPVPSDQLRQLVDQLESWRHQDERLWYRVARLRTRLINRRDHAWQRVAAWLAQDAGAIAVDDWSVSDIAHIPDVDDDQDAVDAYQADAARANARYASPGMLRSAVVNAATKSGVTVHKINVEGVHYDCNTPFDATDRQTSAVVFCSQCDVGVDQDHNALRHLLAGLEANGS